MKLYQVNHVTEAHNTNAVMGMELRFIQQVCCLTGQKLEATRQPDDWQHVKRLTNNLFYAWDDRYQCEGSVYVGVFEANTDKI